MRVSQADLPNALEGKYAGTFLEHPKFGDTLWKVPHGHDALEQSWGHPSCSAVDFIRATFEIALVMSVTLKSESTHFDRRVASSCRSLADGVYRAISSSPCIC